MWLQLFICALLIIFAGTQLTRNGEKISDYFNLSTTWAGALLLPLATTLPELVASRRAAVIGAPDLAGGNIYGSIIFNLTLIALADLLQGAGPLTARRKRGLIVTALFSIIMISCSILAISLALSYRVGWVGVDTLFILALYLLGSGALMRLEKKPAPGGGETGSPALSRQKRPTGPLLKFSLAAVVIVFAGTALTDAAEAIALSTGLNRTLVGSIFIAVTTSLPEVVTITTAVRLGFVEMAIGNVFGANFFNILIFFFTDLFFLRGPVMGSLSPQMLIVASMGLILTAVALLGFIFPLRRHYFRMGATSILILVGYLLTFVFLF